MKNDSSLEREFDAGFSPKLIVGTIGTIIFLVALIMIIAISANVSRRNKVITSYTEETNAHVALRVDMVASLFGGVFESCDKLLAEDQQKRDLAQQPYQQTYTVPCQPAKEHLSKFQVEQLKDSSAIAYVKVAGGYYSLLTASGDYTKSDLPKNGYSYNLFAYNDEIRSDMMQYFENGKYIVMWQDFIPYIPGKEVIVPVNIEGKSIGYIFRGVIER